MFRWAVMSAACMKKNSMMVLMKKFQLKKMMFWWSFCILLIHQPLEQQFTIKCWVSVNHVLQLLSIPTVNTSGCPYTLLKREFKDTQKQFTENLWTWRHSFMHLPIEIFSSTSNSLIIIGNFSKHLTSIHIKPSFFVLYSVIPGYLNEFIYEIMKWNILKIKYHSYEVLNLQVYLIVLVLTHGKL